MIDAPSFRNGIAFCTVKYAPLMLVSNCSSKRLSGVSASGANFATPAFTNKTSILPNFCDTSAYNRATSLSFATSACTATTPFPIALTASSRVFLLRPEMATRAPSSCRRLAVASPMPLFPPVTSATLPSSLFMSVSSEALDLVVHLLEEKVPLAARLGLGPTLLLRRLVIGHLLVGRGDPEIDVIDPGQHQ